MNSFKPAARQRGVDELRRLEIEAYDTVKSTETWYELKRVGLSAAHAEFTEAHRRSLLARNRWLRILQEVEGASGFRGDDN